MAVLAMRTLVLGLGNEILGDDSVGLRVVRELRAQLPPDTPVEVSEDTHGGLRLMERMIGYERAIIVDAIRTGSPPGTLQWLSPGGIPTQRSASTHDVNLPTALSLGRQASALLPIDANIHILAIEAAHVDHFTEVLSREVEEAVPRAVAEILALLEQEESQ
ncbi:MAG: hydrogenase maturation protease [Actinobacteria bacterium]|nr:hydrogenase maturation protease [Actinomycetota bacterium]